MNIIFIGYRGTGKTTISQQLGEHLRRPVFDSDTEIERRAGKSIAEIFAHDGESAFRDLEESVIRELLQRESVILSTGGGAIQRETTRQLLRRRGRVYWLTATPETILRRLQDDPRTTATRPSLTNLPPLQEIVTILEKRIPLYRETSHEMIDTDVLTVEQIVERLASLF